MDKQEAMKQLLEIVDMTIQSCKRDMMTKDGYSKMLCILEKVPEASKKNFVLLCIQRGYPKDTGMEVLKICGIDT
jgi:hypothetical protein